MTKARNSHILDVTAASVMNDLKPIRDYRLMDLVNQAGIDVSDWANFARGPKWAAANPKYCYEWAFMAADKVVVLNVWHANIRNDDKGHYVDTNMRKWAAKLRRERGPKVSAWRRRALKWDQALQIAVSKSLPIRAIITDGRMRKPDDLRGRSHVDRRLLDRTPWHVERYDATTGDSRLRRGGLPHAVVDQFDIEKEGGGVAERHPMTGMAFARDPAIRKSALVRANGRCEWCHEPGFALANGLVYLETHHVIPLSEGGPDRVSNVVALCANHHREAHHGAARNLIRERLLAIAAQVAPSDRRRRRDRRRAG